MINGAPKAIKDHYRTAYSIKRKSILTEFPHFDLFKQTPASVMQILLERVIPLTLQALIKYYIKAKKTTLATINKGIKDFQYGYMETNVKPTCRARHA